MSSNEPSSSISPIGSSDTRMYMCMPHDINFEPIPVENRGMNDSLDALRHSVSSLFGVPMKIIDTDEAISPIKFSFKIRRDMLVDDRLNPKKNPPKRKIRAKE